MSSLGVYLIETFVTLLAVVALAVLVLYGARKWGVGRPAGPLELVGRLPIDARRAVYLVRVGKLVYVLGASEAGLSKLGELGAEGLAEQGDENGKAELPFREILARAKVVKAAKAAAPTSEEAPRA